MHSKAENSENKANEDQEEDTDSNDFAPRYKGGKKVTEHR